MNEISVPDSYKPGLRFLERLDYCQMRDWLLNEVNGKHHALAGQPDDQPVQAILNHAKFLSPKAHTLLSQNVTECTSRWEDSRVEPTIHLLHIGAGLGTKAVGKNLQKTLVPRQPKKRINETLLATMFRTIATLSEVEDAPFWKKVSIPYPKFAGMAFQVLFRLSKNDAWELLGTLIPDQDVAGSIVRALENHIRKLEDLASVVNRT